MGRYKVDSKLGWVQDLDIVLLWSWVVTKIDPRG